jgi:hypothetical protein
LAGEGHEGRIAENSNDEIRMTNQIRMIE